MPPPSWNLDKADGTGTSDQATIEVDLDMTGATNRTHSVALFVTSTNQPLISKFLLHKLKLDNLSVMDILGNQSTRLSGVFVNFGEFCQWHGADAAANACSSSHLCDRRRAPALAGETRHE